MCTARPISWRRSCASWASIASRRRRSTAARLHASRCSRPSSCVRARPSARSRARGMVEAVDLVVHCQAAGRAVRRRQAGTCARQSRSRRTSPTCGRVSFRGCSPPPRRTPIAAWPTWRCSRSDRFSAATAPRTSSPRPAACAARLRSRPALAATGRRPRPRSMPLTPKPTRSRCSSPPARRRRRCRSSRAGRPGCIPAAPARSRSGRRTSSVISASCIPARSRRSMPKAPWSHSR